MQTYISQLLREALGRYEQEKLDGLLDKIAQSGMHSLTPFERRMLHDLGQEKPPSSRHKIFLQVDDGIQWLDTNLKNTRMLPNISNGQGQVVSMILAGEDSHVAHMTPDGILQVNMPLWKHLIQNMGWENPQSILQHLFREWVRRNFTQDKITGVIPMTL